MAKISSCYQPCMSHTNLSLFVVSWIEKSMSYKDVSQCLLTNSFRMVGGGLELRKHFVGKNETGSPGPRRANQGCQSC